MHTLKSAIAEEGGPTKVAEELGISAQRLNNWIDRGIPAEHCADVERAVKFKFRRWDMRQNDWWQIWPELVGAPGAPEVSRSEAA